MKNQFIAKALKQVEEFHNSFGVENNETPTAQLSFEDVKLRFELMKEENEEYLEAAENKDLNEIADALGDQLYILMGTVLKHGLQDKIIPVFNEIHRSNMSKLGSDGKPIYRADGKVLKGENYSEPDIDSIIKNER